MRRLLLALAFALIPAISVAQVVPNGEGWPGVTPPVFGGPSSGVTGGGTVLSPQLLAPDGSASAPSYSFASDPDTGVYRHADNVLGFATAGGGRAQIQSGIFDLFGNSAAIRLGDSLDVSLSRGAANRLDLATGDTFNLVGGGGTLSVAAVPVISSTAPTVTSAGTSPSVSGTNTAAFRVGVGTGGSATTIVLAMPAATTGWNCNAENITAAAANRANQTVKQQSSTTTAVTLQNQTVSTGAALAFTASDVVAVMCIAY